MKLDVAFGFFRVLTPLLAIGVHQHREDRRVDFLAAILGSQRCVGGVANVQPLHQASIADAVAGAFHLSAKFAQAELHAKFTTKIYPIERINGELASRLANEKFPLGRVELFFFAGPGSGYVQVGWRDQRFDRDARRFA